MSGWTFHNPVQVRFGWGALEHLPQALAGRDAVLVTFPEAAATELEARLRDLLGTRLREVIADVEPNPEVLVVPRPLRGVLETPCRLRAGGHRRRQRHRHREAPAGGDFRRHVR